MNSDKSIDWDNVPVDLFENAFLESGYTESSNSALQINSCNAELMDLNSIELESYLTGTGANDGHVGFSLLDEITLSETFNQEADLVPPQPDVLSQIQLEVTEAQPIKEKPTKVEDKSNILIISVPKSMQQSSTFNSLPNIEVDMKTIKKIKKVSSGHSGAFIEPSSEQVNIIRRPPLQVMHQTTPKLETSPLQNIHHSKRKQRFSLRRDDSIMFFGDSHRIVQHRISPSNDFFNYRILDDRVSGSSLPELELNRCPGCKKKFKNLPSHKCKKQLMPDSVKALKLECSVCHLTFNHRVEFFEHTKSHNVLFCACCEMSFPDYEVLKLHLMKCGITDAVKKPFRNVAAKSKVKVVAESQTGKTVKRKATKVEMTAVVENEANVSKINQKKRTKVDLKTDKKKSTVQSKVLEKKATDVKKANAGEKLDDEPKKRSLRVKGISVQATQTTAPKSKKENIVPALANKIPKKMNVEKSLPPKRTANDSAKPAKKKAKLPTIEENPEPKKIMDSKSQIAIKREMPGRAVNKK